MVCRYLSSLSMSRISFPMLSVIAVNSFLGYWWYVSTGTWVTSAALHLSPRVQGLQQCGVEIVGLVVLCPRELTGLGLRSVGRASLGIASWLVPRRECPVPVKCLGPAYKVHTFHRGQRWYLYRSFLLNPLRPRSFFQF